MKYMKRIVVSVSVLALLFGSTGTAFAESALWKVKKDNAVMYLGGTVHLLRESDFPLPEEFNKAYEASETVVFETDVEKNDSASFRRKLLKEVKYGSESSLKEDLSKETYQRLREYCASIDGASFETLKQFKPSFISLILTTIELSNLGASPQRGVDRFFYEKAKDNGKTVEALESPKKQIGFMRKLAEGRENGFIRYTLRDLKNLKEIYNELLKAWENGEAGRINELMVAELKKEFPRIHKRLITERHAEWMPKIEQYMTTPETEFVLVGVAHLVGPDSIISMLRSRDCTVEKLEAEQRGGRSHVTRNADADAFISTWDTTEVCYTCPQHEGVYNEQTKFCDFPRCDRELVLGSSESDQIKLPLVEDGDYDFTVNWGDGNQDNITSWDEDEVTHTYAEKGEHTIKITGKIEGWSFANSGDKLKIQEISQWGNLKWGNTGRYFSGTENLSIPAEDIPDLSGTMSMWKAFQNSGISTVRHMNEWDMSGVKDMSRMFSDAESFNQNISEWDVNSVSDMEAMFSGASSFNQGIGGWNVSSVENMSRMFYKASSFDQDVGDWDVSSVHNMSFMFAWAESFNQDISDWDVSKVKNMRRMFSGAESFDQKISDWDVSSVDNMSEMFAGASAFNQNIGDWDVGNVEQMRGMFVKAASFNRDIGEWDVSNVSEMASMFKGATSFNQDIGDWDVGNVDNISNMFESAESFNQDISEWDVSNVKNMSRMFYKASSFNQNLDGWDVGNVRNMKQMFRGATSFNQDIGNWDVSNVENMSAMFVEAVSFNQDIGGWDVSSVKDMSGMFGAATAFNEDIGDWDVGNVEQINAMFLNADSFNQDIGGWDVSSVKDMAAMFLGADSFNQDLGDWNIGNVEEMEKMFARAKLSTQNYDSLLTDWAKLDVQDDVSFHGGKSQYSEEAADARQKFIEEYSWQIIDGGKVEKE